MLEIQGAIDKLANVVREVTLSKTTGKGERGTLAK